MAGQLTYLDFATDELVYMSMAISKGIKRNPMVSSAQRCCECFLKHLLSIKLLNGCEAMSSHNLRVLFDQVTNAGLDLSPIRSDVMLLNNFYTHTRYPGRDAFLATTADIDAACDAIKKISAYVRRFF